MGGAYAPQYTKTTTAGGERPRRPRTSGIPGASPGRARTPAHSGGQKEGTTMTAAIAAIIAALAEHDAPIYLRGYYRVALPQPPGYPG